MKRVMKSMIVLTVSALLLILFSTAVFAASSSGQVADTADVIKAEPAPQQAGTWTLTAVIFTVMSLILAAVTVTSKCVGRGGKAAATMIALLSAAFAALGAMPAGIGITAERLTLAIVILNIFQAVLASIASNMLGE